MKREQAHNPKRQYRRQLEAQGLITKSGRQWRKFRKSMARMVKEQMTAARAGEQFPVLEHPDLDPIYTGAPLQPGDDPTIQ